MTLYEEKLNTAKVQLELAMAGFDKIGKDILEKETKDLSECFEPYILAIAELKSSVAYYAKEVERDREKE